MSEIRSVHVGGDNGAEKKKSIRLVVRVTKLLYSDGTNEEDFIEEQTKFDSENTTNTERSEFILIY